MTKHTPEWLDAYAIAHCIYRRFGLHRYDWPTFATCYPQTARIFRENMERLGWRLEGRNFRITGWVSQ